jgi:5'-nucleotidase / UDP-sugar diphosphatase
MNQGGVRSAIDAGPITYGDAIAVQPFNNTLVVLDLTGTEIKQALESGKLLVSRGSSFTLAPDKPEGQRVSDVVIAGQPLDPAKVYRCTFNSFVAAGGDALTVVKNAQGKRTDTGLLDVDALIEFIQARSPLDPKAEGRIRIVRG